MNGNVPPKGGTLTRRGRDIGRLGIPPLAVRVPRLRGVRSVNGNVPPKGGTLTRRGRDIAQSRGTAARRQSTAFTRSTISEQKRSA